MATLITATLQHSLNICMFCILAVLISHGSSSRMCFADPLKQMRCATALSNIAMLKQRLAGAAASVAMDGVAPESGQDDPLRE